MSAAEKKAEAEQIVRDLKALAATMSPEELRGAMHCVLVGFNGHAREAKNVALSYCTTTLAAIADALFEDTPMRRCCTGDTYVLPNGSTRRGGPSWAVLCLDCDRCLAVVDGPREEVYADL